VRHTDSLTFVSLFDTNHSNTIKNTINKRTMNNAEFQITGSIVAVGDTERLEGDNAVYCHSICVSGSKNSIYWISRYTTQPTLNLTKGDQVYVKGELRGKTKKQKEVPGSSKYHDYKFVAKRIIKEPVMSEPSGIEV
tara:strand:- start:289 stop:699 length:411 start_codon:yes stop_codon:yes gene_type:complete